MGGAPQYWQAKPDVVEKLQKIRDNDADVVELEVVCAALNHGGGAAIAEAMCVNKTVKKVNITMTELDDEGAVALAAILKTLSWCAAQHSR
jgi:glycine cleavage system pyridoxal-binding protein P